MATRCSHIVFGLTLAFAAAATHAAELGEPQVQSYLGQALQAQVELTLIEDAGLPVTVRLAHPDVYRGANIVPSPVLSSLVFKVTQRGSRQYLQISSRQPVDTRHLHLFLELGDGTQRDVRLLTLWLSPDPHPAPAPRATPAPLAAPVAAPVPPSVALPPAPVPARVVPPVRVRKSAPARPLPKPAPVVQQVAPLQQAPIACQPAAAPEPGQTQACMALTEKNASLQQVLGQLEGKVAQLQKQVSAAPVAAAALPDASAAVAVAKSVPAVAPVVTPAAAPVVRPAAAASAASVPKDAPRIQRKAKKVEPPVEETPWLLITAGVLALLAAAAGVWALLRRRRRASIGKIAPEHKPMQRPNVTPAAAPAAAASAGAAAAATSPSADEAPPPSLMSAVKARLMSRDAKGEAAAPFEPVLSGAATRAE